MLDNKAGQQNSDQIPWRIQQEFPNIIHNVINWFNWEDFTSVVEVAVAVVEAVMLLENSNVVSKKKMLYNIKTTFFNKNKMLYNMKKKKKIHYNIWVLKYTDCLLDKQCHHYLDGHRILQDNSDRNLVEFHKNSTILIEITVTLEEFNSHLNCWIQMLTFRILIKTLKEF